MKKNAADQTAVFRELIRIIPEAVCLYDDAGHRIAGSRSFVHRFGEHLLPEDLFASDTGENAYSRLICFHWQTLASGPARISCGEVRVPLLNNYTGNCDLILESFFAGGVFCGVLCTLSANSSNLVLDEQARGVLLDRTVLLSRVVDQVSSRLEFSENIVRLTGYTAEEFSADPGLIFDNIHPEDMSTVLSSGYMLEQHDHSSCEFRFRRRDGKYISIREEARLICGGEGVPDRILTAWIDLTPSLQVVAPVVRSGDDSDTVDDPFRSIVEEQTELICQLDDQFRFLYVNEAFCRYFSLPPVKLLGQSILQYIPVDQQQRLHEQLHRLTAENPVAVYENCVHMESGETRWQQWVNRAVFDSRGKLLRYQSIGREITELKRNQLDREELLNRLQEKNENLNTVLRTISHDLSTPLANVRGYVQEIEYALEYLVRKYPMLSREQELETVVRNEIPAHIKYIHTSLHRIELLLRSSLRFCRLGQSSLNIEVLDMTSLVREVLHDFDSQILQAGIRVELEPLPECEGDGVFVWQIFSNLISNAIRYRKPDRESRLHIHGYREQDQAVYCVEDNGIGIAAEDLERIFQLFQQGSVRAASGMGIGLALVKELTERLYGSVQVESEPGQGARFMVRLPLPVSRG